MRIAISGLYPPAHWTNVFYVRGSEVGTAEYSELQALSDGVLGAYGDNFAAVCNDNWQLVGAESVWYSGAGPTRVFSATTVIGEADLGSALPANIAVGISWRQVLSYRGGHPRTYLCGVSQGQLDDVTRLTGVAQGNYITAATGFLEDVEALTPGTSIGTIDLGTVSFVEDGDWRGTPIFLHYLSASVDLRIDSQRRRLGRDIPG